MRHGPFFALLILASLAGPPSAGMAQAPFLLDPRAAPYHAKFDGVTDDTVALNAAFAAAANAHQTVRLPAGVKIKVDGNLTFDVSRVSLDCQGAIIDATGATSGATFTLTTTSSPNLMGGLHDAHPVQNCFLNGPDEKSGVDAFHFAGNTFSGMSWMIGMVIDRVSATGYRNFIQTGPGTVALTVQNGALGSDAHRSGTFWTSSPARILAKPFGPSISSSPMSMPASTIMTATDPTSTFSRSISAVTAPAMS